MSNKSEKDAYELVRLDAINQTEGILYVYWRDQRILKLYADTLDRSKKIRDEVKIREQLGQMATGSTDSLNSIINFVEQNYLGTAGLLPEDLAGVSQSLGYIDPTTMTSVEEDEANLQIDAQVATTSALSYSDLKELALAHSPEVDQLVHLYEAAKDAKSAKLYEWLDPTGDPSLPLGFSMVASQRQSKEQLAELTVDQDQTISILYQKLFNAVTEYNLSLASYKKSVEGLTVQKRRFTHASETIAIGTKVDLLSLVQILQDYLTAAISVETNVAQFRIANSKINRLLMKGPYSEVHSISF